MLCVNTTYVASADPSSEFQPLSMQPVEKLRRYLKTMLHDEFAPSEIICQAAMPFASVATASISGILHHEWNLWHSAYAPCLNQCQHLRLEIGKPWDCKCSQRPGGLHLAQSWGNISDDSVGISIALASIASEGCCVVGLPAH